MTLSLLHSQREEALLVLAAVPERAEGRGSSALSLHPGEPCSTLSRVSLTCPDGRMSVPQDQSCPSRRTAFKVGMKLEGIDPLHPSMFCVLTVAEVTAQPRPHRT